MRDVMRMDEEDKSMSWWKKLFVWSQALFKRLTLTLLVAIGGLLVFIWIAEEVVEGDASEFDRMVSLWAYDISNPFTDVVMKSATTMGSIWWMTSAVALLALFTAFYKKRYRLTGMLVLVSLSSGILNAGLKLLFQRNRPDLIDKIIAPQSYSFPSGHAMNSTVIYAMIAFVLYKLYPVAKWPAIVGSVVLVLMIGFSRIYLGVHWFSDVAAGFLAGLTLLSAAAIATRHEPI